MAEEEVDYSSLPLTERFTHKNWKVRKEAYEAAGKEFDNAQSESDPVVRQFVNDTSLWKGAVADSNAAAHQEALACLCSFLNIAGTQGCTRTRNSTIAPLAEKGLISTKPAAKQKALEAILLYVELDKPDPIIDELIPLLSHKLPKIVAATLSAFTAIYHAYGCKIVEPKPVLKTLPKVYGHADKNVRAEAQNLTVELYRWLRESMKPLFWNDLKPVQQTDLDKLFEKVKDEPSPKPERLLKSQQAKVEAAKSQPAAEEDDAADEEDEVEEEPMSIAIDVFPKIPKDLQERLSSSKWKDRKEALNELHTAINAPAIEEGPFNEIMAALAKCMKDANIAVVTVAANCIELLAKGLGKSFAKYRSVVLNPIMERLKERKQSVTDALAAALDAVCQSTSLSDCLEGALEHLSNKNPLIKLESTKFLVRNLKATKEAPSIPETKLIADASAKLLTDSQETQRNAGAEVMGTLWKIMGDRVMNVHFEGLDDIRKAKIKEFMEGAEVRAKYKPKAAPAPKAAAAPPPSKKPAAKKAPAPAKKVASTPKPVRLDSPSPPPPQKLQPKPTAKTAVARPATISSASKGLRPPSNIRPPGSKPPAGPYAQAPASPSRPSYQSSPPASPPQTQPARPQPRGLTGRTLAKPSPAEPSAPQSPPSNNSNSKPLPSIERIELDELRSETDRLRQSNESLRSDHLKLSDQIHELQNQNAQLIEDHTRDVLSIKAKETQLVRARSDAETAEQSVGQLTREVERLKRELGRMGRATSPRASDIGAADIFASSLDATTSASTTAQPQRSGVISPTERVRQQQSSSSRSPARPTPNRPLSAASNPRQQHRPELADSDGNPKAPPGGTRQTSADSGIGSDARSSGGSNGVSLPNHSTLNPKPGPGAGAGRYTERKVNGSSTTNTTNTGAGSGAGGAAGGEGVESWKRAAEVTQNLKARIELMKQRQQGMQR